MNTSSLILRNVCCQKWLNRPEPSLVRDLSLEFSAGSRFALTGPGGCGRNLCLHLAGLLETPDSGEILYDGQSLTALSAADAQQVRNQLFGYVLETPWLLPSLTVLENVATPLLKLSHLPHDDARERTEKILNLCEVFDLVDTETDSLPPSLQYRVSMARALVLLPKILLVEEVERRLSAEEAAQFAACVKAASTAFGMTVLWSCETVVTGYDPLQTFRFQKGRVQEETVSSPPYS